VVDDVVAGVITRRRRRGRCSSTAGQPGAGPLPEAAAADRARVGRVRDAGGAVLVADFVDARRHDWNHPGLTTWRSPCCRMARTPVGFAAAVDSAEQALKPGSAGAGTRWSSTSLISARSRPQRGAVAEFSTTQGNELAVPEWDVRGDTPSLEAA
jgi:hypothetical protein